MLLLPQRADAVGGIFEDGDFVDAAVVIARHDELPKQIDLNIELFAVPPLHRRMRRFFLLLGDNVNGAAKDLLGRAADGHLARRRRMRRHGKITDGRAAPRGRTRLTSAHTHG